MVATRPPGLRGGRHPCLFAATGTIARGDRPRPRRPACRIAAADPSGRLHRQRPGQRGGDRAADFVVPLAVRTVNLLGDHERMLLDALGGGPRGRDRLALGWRQGITAKAGRSIRDLPRPEARWEAALPPAHVAFLRGLKRMHRAGDYLFVHAGIRPGASRWPRKRWTTSSASGSHFSGPSNRSGRSWCTAIRQRPVGGADRQLDRTSTPARHGREVNLRGAGGGPDRAARRVIAPPRVSLIGGRDIRDRANRDRSW